MKKNKLKQPQVPQPVKPEARAINLNIGLLIKKNWPFLVGLSVLVLIIYAFSVGSGLVSDDKGLSDPNNFNSLKTTFAEPFSSLRLIFYNVTYSICGATPACYRIPSILAHIGNVWLVFIIVALLMRPRIGLFAAALFAVHPILVESVTWISAGAYVDYTFLFLVALLLYIISGKMILQANGDKQAINKSRLFYWSGVGIFIIALFTTNRVMAIPIFFLYEFSLGNIKKNWLRLTPFLGFLIIWSLTHLLMVSHRVDLVTAGANVNNFTYNPLFQWPFSVSSYLELIFWPDGLSFYHSNIDVPAFVMALRWLVLLAFLGFITFGWFKNRLVFFWGSFFFLGLLLYLLPIQLAWLVAERYVYLGSIGVFVLLAIGINYLTKIKKLKLVVLIIFGLILAALSVRSIVRNIDWKTEDTLMTSTVRTNPENAKVHNHIGTIYGKKKDYVNAMKEFEIAEKLDPALPDSYHNIGNAYYEQKDFAKAIPFFEKATQVDPNHWMSYQILANIYFDSGDYAKAADNINKILPINPNPALYTNLGIIYLKMGDKVKAKEAFSIALKYDTTNTLAQAAVANIDDPNLLGPAPSTPGTVAGSSAPQVENPAMPGGQLPPEVLKQLQEQQQKAALSSVPASSKTTPTPTVKR